MSINPYEAPHSPASPAERIEPQSNSLVLVTSQRAMMWLLIAKLGFDFSAGAVGDLLAPPLLLVYWLAYLVVSAAIAFFVFRLANFVYGVGPVIICAVLSFLPCLGTLTVLVLNGNVMDRLRKTGVKVGFMGATAQ